MDNYYIAFVSALKEMIDVLPLGAPWNMWNFIIDEILFIINNICIN